MFSTIPFSFRETSSSTVLIAEVVKICVLDALGSGPLRS
jgi:hypothetical protein